MAHIFISYSRIDESFARQLAEALSRAGADVWLDVDDIPAGMNWSSAIQQGLRDCELMIIIISPESMASRNVDEEWQYYKDKNKPIVPVLWRQAEIHYQLSRLQYVDFEKQPFERAFKQLFGELGRKGIALTSPIETTGSSGAIPTQPPLPVRTPRKRTNWLLIAGAVITLLAGGLLALNAINSGNTPTSTPPTIIAAEVTTAIAAIDSPTPTLSPTPEPTPTPRPTNTPQPTLDATQIEASITAEMALIALGETATIAFNQTATAQQWTPVPTADVRATAQARATEARLAQFATETATQAIFDATATVEAYTDTPTPTATFTPTSTQTPTPTQPPLPTPTPIPIGFAGNPVTNNAQWTLYIEQYARTFDGIEMVLVPVGCFQMGNDPEAWNAGTRATGVPSGGEQCFNEPFWIGRYEVTNAQYGSSGQYDGDQRPRESITWFEARDFCAVRGLRLPSEAEWEYAARGPDAPPYPWGFAWNGNNAVWNRGTEQGTANVGSKPWGRSWVGADDMSGNVSEWTSSIFSAYPYSPQDGREQNSDDTSVLRTLRGGSWFDNYAFGLQAAARGGDNQYLGYITRGVRCARDF